MPENYSNKGLNGLILCADRAMRRVSAEADALIKSLCTTSLSRSGPAQCFLTDRSFVRFANRTSRYVQACSKAGRGPVVAARLFLQANLQGLMTNNKRGVSCA